MEEIKKKRGERGKDRNTRLRKMTDARRAEYYEKIVYYRCMLCNERWNIFKAEGDIIGHLLNKHKLKLDEDDKIALLRKYYGTTYLTEEDCLEYGIDFDRFKRYKGD